MELSLADVKEKVDIIALIGSYISLKKRAGMYWGLCPFHPEKTPSFVVNNHKNFFHCFGCGIHGDIFFFIQKYHNYSFPESVDMVCKKSNLPVPHVYDRKDSHKVLNEVSQVFRKYISNNEWIKNRNIKEEIINSMEIGYCPLQCLKEILALDKPSTLKELGILGTYGNLTLQDRVVFPIKNIQGEIVGFSGRSTDGSEPKYKNTKETEVFSRSCSLYNIHNVLGKKSVIIVEGFFDVTTMVQWGFDNTVGSMGTAVTLEQMFYLTKKFHEIILLFDGDNAGKKAEISFAENALKLIETTSEFYLAHLPLGADPDNFLNTMGYDAMQQVLNKKQHVLEFLWDVITKDSPKAFEDLLGLKKRINILLNTIVSNDLRCLAKEYWNSKIEEYKKILTFHKPLPIPGYTYNNPEVILMGILLTYPNLFEEYIEELCIYNYSNKNIEKIVHDLIENKKIPEVKANFFIHHPMMAVMGRTIEFAREFVKEFLYRKPQKLIITPPKKWDGL